MRVCALRVGQRDLFTGSMLLIRPRAWMQIIEAMSERGVEQAEELLRLSRSGGRRRMELREQLPQEESLRDPHG
jgi:hypothetical protein